MKLLALRPYYAPKSAPAPYTGRCSMAGKCVGCGHDDVSVGRSPYDLHHANASRFKAVGELGLLADHMTNDPCMNCMNKHAIVAARFMSEAADLNDGDHADIATADEIEVIRQMLAPSKAEWVTMRAHDGGEIVVVPDVLRSHVRKVRSNLQEKLHLSH